MENNQIKIMVTCPKCKSVCSLEFADRGEISCPCNYKFPVDAGEIVDVELLSNGKIKVSSRKLGPTEISYKKNIFHNKIFIPLQVTLVTILFFGFSGFMNWLFIVKYDISLFFILTWSIMFYWIIIPKILKFIVSKEEQYVEKLKEEKNK